MADFFHHLKALKASTIDTLAFPDTIIRKHFVFPPSSMLAFKPKTIVGLVS